MARPRVFISSTYYDLKYLRSSIEVFVESLGYDAILSEKGEVPYASDRALDESCYREVHNCNIYVLIIGGRYGSASSESRLSLTDKDLEDHNRKYESITKKEYKAAADNDIPIYILIERAVHAEYQTYLKNKENTGINYAHVDTINVFKFIDEIMSKPRNNPVQTFDRYSDIQEWLREQWAGTFRDLLHSRTSQQQLTSLATQVQTLSEVNTTLRRYLEELMTKIVPDATQVISEETERLDKVKQTAIQTNPAVDHLLKNLKVNISKLYMLLKMDNNWQDFIRLLCALGKDEISHNYIKDLSENPDFMKEMNKARSILGLPPFEQQ